MEVGVFGFKGEGEGAHGGDGMWGRGEFFEGRGEVGELLVCREGEAEVGEVCFLLNGEGVCFEGEGVCFLNASQKRG